MTTEVGQRHRKEGRERRSYTKRKSGSHFQSSFVSCCHELQNLRLEPARIFCVDEASLLLNFSLSEYFSTNIWTNLVIFLKKKNCDFAILWKGRWLLPLCLLTSWPEPAGCGGWSELPDSCPWRRMPSPDSHEHGIPPFGHLKKKWNVKHLWVRSSNLFMKMFSTAVPQFSRDVMSHIRESVRSKLSAAECLLWQLLVLIWGESLIISALTERPPRKGQKQNRRLRAPPESHSSLSPAALPSHVSNVWVWEEWSQSVLLCSPFFTWHLSFLLHVLYLQLL